MGTELYKVEEVSADNSKIWETIEKESCLSTPFIREDYLNAVGFTSKKYIVQRKNKPYMGLCIPIEISSGEPKGVVPYAPYQGFLYLKNEKNHTDYQHNLEATELLLDYIYETKAFSNLAFSNSYKVNDLRGVQWHHYHQPELGMFQIGLRYTAIKSIDAPAEKIGTSRNYEAKYAIERYGLHSFYSDKTEPFMDLYERTFSRQNIHLEYQELDKVKKIIDTALENEYGQLWYIETPDGVITNGLVVLYDKHGYGYELFAANHPDHRKLGGNTRILLDVWDHLKKYGIKYFDFLGANSPQRGFYKLSFEAELVPYYICSVKYDK